MKLDPASLYRIFGNRVAPDGNLVRDNFARWFGSSRVVDACGAPVVAFHGTHKSFDSFKVPSEGQNDAGWYGRGIYLTADLELAAAYAEHAALTRSSKSELVIAAYVRLCNPYVWPEGRPTAKTSEEAMQITRALTVHGHDGVIFENRFASDNYPYAAFFEIVAFEASQLKSVRNCGLFDPRSDSLSDALPARACSRGKAQRADFDPWTAEQATRHAERMRG